MCYIEDRTVEREREWQTFQLNTSPYKSLASFSDGYGEDWPVIVRNEAPEIILGETDLPGRGGGSVIRRHTTRSATDSPVLTSHILVMDSHTPPGYKGRRSRNPFS